MVEAAKAHNPFAAQTKAEITNQCPHMSRLGICLEPMMCFLYHKTPETEASPAELSTAAKAFNPFTTAAAVQPNPQSKEFVPSQQEQTAQSGIINMLSRMGIEAQVDPELGTIFIQQFESCDCCHGLINNCRGDLCENLGMCFCVSHSLHQDQ